MAVELARVDNRLVHGQVLEAWAPRLHIDTILVVDAALGTDRLRKMVLEGLSRPGLRVQIVAPEEACRQLAGPLREARVMLLFRGLAQAAAARDAGVPLAALNLGNLHARPDSTALTLSVHLTPEDTRVLRCLIAQGVALEARGVPTDSSPDVGRWLAARPPC